jgi:hypothetical protein
VCRTLVRLTSLQSSAKALSRQRFENRCTIAAILEVPEWERVDEGMNWKSRFILGVLTALAMMAGTYLLPRGGALRDASLVQFPLTVGVWAIFVLLFVKLK